MNYESALRVARLCLCRGRVLSLERVCGLATHDLPDSAIQDVLTGESVTASRKPLPSRHAFPPLPEIWTPAGVGNGVHKYFFLNEFKYNNVRKSFNEHSPKGIMPGGSFQFSELERVALQAFTKTRMSLV